MKVLLVAVVSLCAYIVNAQECGQCGPCEDPLGCVAGTVKDACGCCDVCAKAQYELCDHPDLRRRVKYGRCGKNLDCVLRNDLQDEDEPEAICLCRSRQEVCANNSQTYENICDLSAANARRPAGTDQISVRKLGPCQAIPVILSAPEHTKNKTGSEVALSCEAKGYPIPVIEWTWRRVDGRTVYLPSDDLHISVNMRGGPEKWQVTGWLQITDIKKDHEGDYTCIAQNEAGMVQETARVNVVASGDAELKMRHHNRL